MKLGGENVSSFNKKQTQPSLSFLPAKSKEGLQESPGDSWISRKVQETPGSPGGLKRLLDLLENPRGHSDLLLRNHSPACSLSVLPTPDKLDQEHL